LPTAPYHSPPLSLPTRRSSDLKQALAAARIELRAARHKLSALGVSEASLQQLASQPDASLTRYEVVAPAAGTVIEKRLTVGELLDRKSTRLNSSHQIISYAVFC